MFLSHTPGSGGRATGRPLFFAFSFLPVCFLLSLPQAREAPTLVQPSLTPIHSQTPQVREGGEAPREGQPSRGTPSQFPPLFSPLQHSSPTPGSIFAPSHLNNVTSLRGYRTIGGLPGWGPMEHPSACRGSRQTGASSALEAWMLRSIRSPTCWQIWTGVAVMLLGDQTDRLLRPLHPMLTVQAP